MEPTNTTAWKIPLAHIGYSATNVPDLKVESNKTWQQGEILYRQSDIL